MKILILVPVWKRPEVFRVMAENLIMLPARSKVVVALSKEDPDYFANLETVIRYGFTYQIAPNFPVGAKMNRILKKILMHMPMDWDYIMGLNSDDILDHRYFNIVRPYLEAGHPMVGMRQIVAWDVPNQTGKKLILESDNPCKVWGGGRFLSREAIEKTWEKLGYIYQDDLNSGLDTSSQRNIFENVLFDKEPIVIDDCYLVDLKTEENINPYSSLKWIPYEGVEYEWVKKKFGDIKKYFK